MPRSESSTSGTFALAGGCEWSLEKSPVPIANTLSDSFFLIFEKKQRGSNLQVIVQVKWKGVLRNLAITNRSRVSVAHNRADSNSVVTLKSGFEVTQSHWNGTIR